MVKTWEKCASEKVKKYPSSDLKNFLTRRKNCFKMDVVLPPLKIEEFLLFRRRRFFYIGLSDFNSNF